jgi:hypothetical protein
MKVPIHIFEAMKEGHKYVMLGYGVGFTWPQIGKLKMCWEQYPVYMVEVP